MNLRTELKTLTDSDIYSLLLFALYKMHGSDEYSSLSELSYILDRDSLLKLCEFYGGTTIRIPTVEELEIMLSALLVFQLVDIEGMTYDNAMDNLRKKTGHTKSIEQAYKSIRECLQNYNFNSGR